jgi:hypothetical protein
MRDRLFKPCEGFQYLRKMRAIVFFILIRSIIYSTVEYGLQCKSI